MADLIKEGEWPDIKGFIRVSNSQIEGCTYFRNNGFGTIDQIAVKRDNVHIIGGEDEPPKWVVALGANVQGKWVGLMIDETIWQLAEQINKNS